MIDSFDVSPKRYFVTKGNESKQLRPVRQISKLRGLSRYSPLRSMNIVAASATLGFVI